MTLNDADEEEYIAEERREVIQLIREIRISN
jgi:hypothetical protein